MPIPRREYPELLAKLQDEAVLYLSFKGGGIPQEPFNFVATNGDIVRWNADGEVQTLISRKEATQ